MQSPHCLATYFTLSVYRQICKLIRPTIGWYVQQLLLLHTLEHRCVPRTPFERNL